MERVDWRKVAQSLRAEGMKDLKRAMTGDPDTDQRFKIQSRLLLAFSDALLDGLPEQSIGRVEPVAGRRSRIDR